ncbi:MAG: hypothetical protein RLZZ312_265 [Bacteroidota bacterium]|jgi:hypothetical protein
MKNLLVLVLLSFSMITFAQDQPAKTEQEAPKKIYKTNKNLGKNEIKLNTTLLLVGGVEMSYERILTDESSAGITIGGSIDKSTIDYNFSIEPYYRYFFGKKPAAGFFVEGFGSINSRNLTYYNNNGFGTLESKVNAGLGVGLGGKFITSNNIVFEIGFGLGRNLTARRDEMYNYNGPDAVLITRGGLLVGYRF